MSPGLPREYAECGLKHVFGIVRISEVKVAGAVREISIERGYHPKDFALLAYGGGGGFLAARVARELSIPTVIPHCS